MVRNDKQLEIDYLALICMVKNVSPADLKVQTNYLLFKYLSSLVKLSNPPAMLVHI